MTDHIKTRDRDGNVLDIAATERGRVQYPLNHLMNAAGTTIDPATEGTAAAVLSAAQSIKTAAEAINTKTPASPATEGTAASLLAQVQLMRLADLSSIDRFGRLKVANPVALFDNANDMSANPLLWETLAVGAGVAAYRPNECCVRLTTGGTVSGASIIQQTKQRIRYQPGRMLSIERTWACSVAQTNARSRHGFFDADNGIFWQRDGTTVSLVQRTNVTGTPVDVVIPQANWNGDTFGAGALNPSGKTIDWTKTQLMRIEVAFLGVDGWAVYFKIGGVLYLAHEANYSNDLPTVYQSTGALPLRSEITNTGTAGGTVTLDTICSSVSSYGLGAEQIQFSRDNIIASRATSTTPLALISIRAATVLGGVGVGTVQNRGLIKPVEFEVNVASGTHRWALILNATLTGASWVANNSASIADYDVSATTLSGGYTLSSGYVYAAGAARGAVRDALAKALPLTYSNLTGTQDTLTLAVQTLTGAGTALGSMTWIEEY